MVGSGSFDDTSRPANTTIFEFRPTPVTTIEEQITKSNDVIKVRKVAKRAGVV
jgi:hypothetical protein